MSLSHKLLFFVFILGFKKFLAESEMNENIVSTCSMLLFCAQMESFYLRAAE